MKTVTFEDGTSMKILIDEMEWSKKTHKYFNKSLNPIIITLLCIQKNHYRQIDKNIFLKIIREMIDDSYLVDVSLFADFILTQSKHCIFNTYETFRREKHYHLFNHLSVKQVNPKYMGYEYSDINNVLIFTRGRKDIHIALEEIRDHKILGLVMILSNTIEIIYLDVSQNISGLDFSLTFPFFQNLEKKEEIYNILRNMSSNQISFPALPKFSFFKQKIIDVMCVLLFYYIL